MVLVDVFGFGQLGIFDGYDSSLQVKSILV